ncbi:velvet factor-domain-containing protein [Lentinula aciculospora]|uniref:Velvet factor-domain-containing protein n=1 Tax=Lentinula aciculospora TaxID=153920 RepID=A0A9W8ZZI5_9AGAR|nr:velvet factor-domain-containing protein [Lentinula aciculospora]
MPRQRSDNRAFPLQGNSNFQVICLEQGQRVSKSVRAELHELQHAVLGQIYDEVYRRPLDPPPIVMLRLFELVPTSRYDLQEKEISSYENIEILGMLCAVELVPNQVPTHGKGDMDANSPSTYHSPTPISSQGSSTSNDTSVSESEIARLTAEILIGSKVAQSSLIKIDGQKSLLFVFPDLAVKNQGLFKLRYKFFDLFSAVPGRAINIESECTGGAFCVYTSKDFPGLQKSTELTKVCFHHKGHIYLS